MSVRQVSGMIMRPEEELVVDLSEPESLLLPALRESCGERDGAQPGETVGDGEGLLVVLGELMVSSEVDAELCTYIHKSCHNYAQGSMSPTTHVN